MKKLLKIQCLTAVCAVLLACLCSCSKMVSFIRFPSDEDSTRYKKVFEVEEKTGKGAVIFYANEDIYDIKVIETEYDADKNEYSEINTLWVKDTLTKGDGIKIWLDFSKEVPYIKVCYMRQNGETREQFIYKNAETGKLWLLEQSI